LRFTTLHFLQIGFTDALTFILYSTLFLYLVSACRSSIAQNWRGRKKMAEVYSKEIYLNYLIPDLPQPTLPTKQKINFYNTNFSISKKRLFAFDTLSIRRIKSHHLAVKTNKNFSHQ
jgi:hypothetical protein